MLPFMLDYLGTGALVLTSLTAAVMLAAFFYTFTDYRHSRLRRLRTFTLYFVVAAVAIGVVCVACTGIGWAANRVGLHCHAGHGCRIS